MTAQEKFYEALEQYVAVYDSPAASDTLVRLCGKLWNCTSSVPQGWHHMVRDAIVNWVDADQWAKNGAAVAGAAGRISFRIKHDRMENSRRFP